MFCDVRLDVVFCAFAGGDLLVVAILPPLLGGYIVEVLEGSKA